MPAYSFKERFVPWVKDGSKPGTIRSFRKYPVKEGQLAHLFYGMRTKYCIKLVEPAPALQKVWSIYMGDTGDVALIGINWMNTGLAANVVLFGKIEVDKLSSVHWLTGEEKDKLAWIDGFRHPSDPLVWGGCFELMYRWWKQTNGLPFVGNYSVWNVKPLFALGLKWGDI